jgi:L-lactate dehydrogenase (cytochrome)
MGGTCESDTNCITLAQLQRHNTATDCWIAIHGNGYDLTNYANRHPGGAQVITILAGSDGTAAYARFHSGGLLGSLQSGELIGWLEGSTGGNVVTFDGDGWESISDSESED